MLSRSLQKVSGVKPLGCRRRIFLMKIRATARTVCLILVVMAVLVAASAIFSTVRARSDDNPSHLPSMTLVYEVHGPEVSVGESSVPPYKEVRQLEHRSSADWTERVIKSPSIELGRYGSASNVGAYRKLNGKVLTEYDPLDGDISESTIGDGVTFVPNAAFTFTHSSISPLGDEVKGVAVTTDATVCFNGECEDNAGGIRYSTDRMSIVVMGGDNWMIPIEYGDLFLLRSADIQAREP